MSADDLFIVYRIGSLYFLLPASEGGGKWEDAIPPVCSRYLHRAVQ